MTDIDHNARTINDLEHISGKAMWAGTSKKCPKETLISFNVNPVEQKLVPRVLSGCVLIPALMKCYDELIVNAVDHVAACRAFDNKQDQVSKIDIKYDVKTGLFKICNDGHGIDISRYPETDENCPGMYKPYVFFTREKQGSNTFKDEECIKAGTNGYGSKIVLAHSKSMTVSCGTRRQKKTYTHTHSNDPKTGRYKLGSPIVKTNVTTADYTEISFTPIEEGPVAPPVFITKSDIDAWLTRRIVYIVAYLQSLIKTFNLRKVTVTYNGIDMSWITLSDIAKAFAKEDTEIITIKLKPIVEYVNDQFTLYPMDLIFCVKGIDLKESVISNTNGTLVYEGAHLKPLMKQILENISSEVSKQLKNDEIAISNKQIKSSCLILINAILPGLEFGEQSKRTAIIDDAICEQYTLSSANLKSISKLILATIMSKNFKKLKAAMKKKMKASDKFSDACSGAKNRSDFILIICEGDSALDAVRNNISALEYDIDKIGFMTLAGGVPNVRKNCTIIDDPKSPDNGQIIVDTMTMNNIFINTLMKAVGLMIGEYADITKLRYSKIICCVDQDHDGKGKLFGLVMNIIHYFWEELLVDGDFVYRLETPIKRIYNGKKLISEFMYEHAYKNYVVSTNSAGTAKRSHKLNYYKGLGSHTPAEMRSICKNMFSNIRGYKIDTYGTKLMGQYYDDDSSIRKKLLNKPLSFADPIYKKLEGLTIIPIGDFLNTDLFLFAKDDIIRKLPHAIDGLNNSGRKIVNGILTKMKTKEKTKVVELAGSITKSQNYHHGEACLEENIKHKCFITVGGRQLPLLLPSGQFGSRLCGGANASAGRYIYAHHNIDLTSLLYPTADYGLLNFTEDDGKFYEPDYFVPIVPMSILETTFMPAHGWNFKVIARNIFTVIRCVRSMIIDPMYRSMGPIDMALHGFTGKYCVDFRNGDEYTSGTYEILDDEIIISELPYITWINKYSREIKAKILFYELDARLGSPKIEEDNTFTMSIKLGPKFWDKISEKTTETDENVINMTKISKKNTDESLGKEVKGQTDSKKSKKAKKAKKDTKKDKKESTEEVESAVKLNGNAKVRVLVKNEKFSLESFLCLNKSHKSALNMIGTDHSVITFKSYFSILQYWFNVRRDLYVERVARQLVIMELEYELIKDTIVFLNEYDFKRRTVDAIKKIIRSLGLRAFNSTLIGKPGRTATKDLRALCIASDDQADPEINYKYALSLKVSDTSSEKVKKLILKNNQLLLDIELFRSRTMFGHFTGAMIWLDELDALEAVVTKGINSWWIE